jgi:hypothetical protein
LPIPWQWLDLHVVALVRRVRRYERIDVQIIDAARFHFIGQRIDQRPIDHQPGCGGRCGELQRGTVQRAVDEQTVPDMLGRDIPVEARGLNDASELVAIILEVPEPHALRAAGHGLSKEIPPVAMHRASPTLRIVLPAPPCATTARRCPRWIERP